MGSLSKTIEWVLILFTATAMLVGCTQQPANHYVLASTGTVIGVDLSLDPVKQTPQGRLGYHRGEIAIVPSNRRICTIKSDTEDLVCEDKPNAKGAAGATDVLMEIYYGEIFSGNGSIYQRLAVGNTAVQQDGAAIMFAKTPNGKIDPSTANALRAIKGLQRPSIPSDPILRQRYVAALDCSVVIRGKKPEDIKKFDQAVQPQFKNWEDFLDNARNVTAKQMDVIESNLLKNGIDLKTCKEKG